MPTRPLDPLRGKTRMGNRFSRPLSAAEWKLAEQASGMRRDGLDSFTRSHTGYSSFSELVREKTSYRPTLRPDIEPAFRALASAYDAIMEARGDERRAYVPTVARPYASLFRGRR